MLAVALNGVSIVFASEETCASCGPEVSVTAEFAHYKADSSVAIQGAGNHAAAFHEEIVTVDIPAARLRCWNTEKKQYVVENGDYELLIGAAADDLRLKLPMTIAVR